MVDSGRFWGCGGVLGELWYLNAVGAYWVETPIINRHKMSQKCDVTMATLKLLGWPDLCARVCVQTKEFNCPVAAATRQSRTARVCKDCFFFSIWIYYYRSYKMGKGSWVNPNVENLRMTQICNKFYKATWVSRNFYQNLVVNVTVLGQTLQLR